VDIITAISAGTKALEALKAIRDIDKSYDAATWKAKVAELMSDIADMKLALVEANDKIHTLDREKEALAAQVVFKAEKTVHQKGFLYEIFSDGEVAEFPFCQNCMTTGKYVRIVRMPGNSGCVCPGCKTQYDIRSVLHNF
jgi:hypothetical protein